jgi:hypothetical protein
MKVGIQGHWLDIDLVTPLVVEDLIPKTRIGRLCWELAPARMIPEVSLLATSKTVSSRTGEWMRAVLRTQRTMLRIVYYSVEIFVSPQAAYLQIWPYGQLSSDQETCLGAIRFGRSHHMYPYLELLYNLATGKIAPLDGSNKSTYLDLLNRE